MNSEQIDSESLTALAVKLHRTWIEALIHNSFNECAAIIVNAEVSFGYEWDYDINRDCISSFIVQLPYHFYSIVTNDERVQETLRKHFLEIANGNTPDWSNEEHFLKSFVIKYKVKLLEIEQDWQKTVKYLISKSKELNQGVITEKAYARDKKDMILYNEMKFGSQSEVRIAQELEKKRILFFPLPMAVRYETGTYKDRREVDFLVCLDGAFGVLEVAYHPYRYELDKEKDMWLKNAGILCVENYSAEKCYQNPTAVVNEFLSVLSRYKK